MAQLTAAERLARIKTALGLSGTDYQDDTLSLYIDEVIEEMVIAGVARTVAESAAAVGCIAVGVNDLWNYSSGGVKHSEYFNRRLIQLTMAGQGNAPEERHERLVFDSNANSITFSLPYTERSVIRIFVNGLAEAENDDYTISEHTITFNGATMIAGTEVDVYVYD